MPIQQSPTNNQYTDMYGTGSTYPTGVYSYTPNGTGGVNYFHDGVPITNTQYAQDNAIYGVDTNQIEAQALADYQRAPYVPNSPKVLGASTTGTSSGYTSGDIEALQQNDSLLNSLLGRLQTGIDQGNQKINDQYGQELSNANLAKDRQLGAYGDQVTSQKLDREKQLGQINQNANVGMNSLRNIVGRSSGSGSSVYKELLPYLVGNDMSSNRRGVMNTTGENLQNIDKAKSQYEADFAGVLQDLMNQKRQNEQNLMSGIEGQRQGYLQQQLANSAQLAQAQGGGYDQVKQAIAPIQVQYDQSLNNVDSFFNQFKPNYTPNQKAAPTPELNTYTVDRANINAANNAGTDNSNPYAALLRKKLTGQA